VLYLPRGWIHAAQAQQEMSLHLTIGVHPCTRRHVAQAVVAEVLARHERELERSLPLGVDVADPTALTAVLDEVRTLMTDAVRALDPAAVAHRLERRRADDTRPAPLRPVAQVTAMTATTPLVVRPRLGVRLRVDESVGALALVVDGRRVALEPSCAAAAKAVVTATTVSSDDLPGLDPLAGRALVATLLREGAVVPA
jgi:bifunctional lysine-specific demethylase and histidyl-hydroxylase NO66